LKTDPDFENEAVLMLSGEVSEWPALSRSFFFAGTIIELQLA